MTRFVFDTNVIISAVLFNNSVPGQAFIRVEGHLKKIGVVCSWVV